MSSKHVVNRNRSQDGEYRPYNKKKKQKTSPKDDQEKFQTRGKKICKDDKKKKKDTSGDDCELNQMKPPISKELCETKKGPKEEEKTPIQTNIPFLTMNQLEERAQFWNNLFEKYSFEQTEEEGIALSELDEEDEPAFNEFVFDPATEVEEDLVIDGAELIATPQNAVALLPEQQYQRLVAQFEPGFVDAMVEVFKESAREAEKLDLPFRGSYRIEKMSKNSSFFNEQICTPHLSRDTTSARKRRDLAVVTFCTPGHSAPVASSHTRYHSAPDSCSKVGKQTKPELGKFSFSLPGSIQKLVADGTRILNISVHERTFNIHVQQNDITGIAPLVFDVSMAGPAKSRKKGKSPSSDEKSSSSDSDFEFFVPRMTVPRKRH